ncbi:MAG: T9SS type A sorting domain-containing protein [Saprospiraceae bacterium]|nr:T9SS type A sorting domain-containing protein [Saprospiraceae bacterium]
MMRVCFVAILIGFLSHSVLAQWRSIGGPEGGHIRVIFEEAGGTLLAANQENLYRKGAVHESWELVLTPFENLPVLTITQSPSGSLYLGLGSILDTTHTVFRTDPGFSSWQRSELARGTDVRTMISLSDEKLVISVGSSVLVSNDNGLTAVESSLGDDVIIQKLVEDHKGQILAATNKGLYYSDSELINWQQVPTIGSDHFIIDMEVNAQNQVCVLDLTSEQVFFGDSLEGNFRNITFNMGGFPLSGISFDVANNLFASTFDGKIFSYDERDNRWLEFFNNGLEEDGITSLLKSTDGDLIFAMEDDGVWEINQAGETSTLSQGLVATEIMSMANIDGDVLVSTKNSIYRWETMEDNWLEILVDNDHFQSRSMLTQASDKIIAASNNGVMAITITDTSASIRSLGLPDLRIVFLAQDPNDNIYAGTFTDGLYVSNTSDSTWTDISDGTLRNSVLTDMEITTAGNFLASSNQGIFISEDQGDTWNVSLDGIPGVSDLTQDTKGYIYAASGKSILKSVDQGKQWTSYPVSPQRPIRRLLATSDGSLYAGMEREGISHSPDEGQTWTKLSEGLTTSTIVNLIESENGNILAGSAGGGVFLLERSTALNPDVSSLNIIVSTFPNPVKDILNIKVNIRRQQNVHLKLVNLQGQLIQRQNQMLTAGENMVSLDLANNRPGCYFLICEVDDQTAVNKVLKSNY